MSGDPDTDKILGAAFEVHNELGPGFLEAVYQEAFAVELELRNVPTTAQQELRIAYKGNPLKKKHFTGLILFVLDRSSSNSRRSMPLRKRNQFRF